MYPIHQSQQQQYKEQQQVYSTPKQEEDLANHIKKALSNDDVAPKQKHVRACILYTWDVKGSLSLHLYPSLISFSLSLSLSHLISLSLSLYPSLVLLYSPL
jgi:hypothetical protein